MIDYESGYWNCGFVLTLTGSVFPKALCWSIPAGLLCAVYNQWVVGHHDTVGTSQVWAAYNFVLGFLMIFRTQQAYQRFWEGATMLSQVRGEWFNAVSSCFAFCTSDPKKQSAVTKFQHQLVRLASLLYCCALQQVAVMADETFEILDLDGISEDSLTYLASAPDKCLVILQWIQKSIVLAAEDGTISVAPPILSRVYQELSRGIVHVVDVQKITDIPFPFPYAQMVTTMLLLSTLATPMINAMLIKDVFVCSSLTFISVFAMWCINYIAAEIEMPFGEDSNDLPIASLLHGFNTTLRMLLEPGTQSPPEYKFNPDQHGWVQAIQCPFELITNDESSVWVTPPAHLRRLREQQRKMEHYNNTRTQEPASCGLELESVPSAPSSLGPETKNKLKPNNSRTSIASAMTSASAKLKLRSQRLGPTLARQRSEPVTSTPTERTERTERLRSLVCAHKELLRCEEDNVPSSNCTNSPGRGNSPTYASSPSFKLSGISEKPFPFETSTPVGRQWEGNLRGAGVDEATSDGVSKKGLDQPLKPPSSVGFG